MNPSIKYGQELEIVIMTGYINKLNFVSRRELKNLASTDQGGKWGANYMFRLRAHAKSAIQTTELRQMLRLAFPNSEWYEQPYSKIYAAAKLTTDKEFKGSMPANYFDKADVQFVLGQRRRMQALRDSTFARICKRYYTAKAVEDVIEQCDWSCGPNWYQSPEQVLRNGARIVSYLKKYDKQDLKQLKQVTDAVSLRAYANNADDIRRLDCGCYRNDLAQTMTDKQLSELIKKLCKAILGQLSNDKEEKYWGERENVLINQVQWASGRVSCANIACTQAFEKAAKATLELDKVCEMHEIAKQLGMSADDRFFASWRANRVNNKTYRLMKQCKSAFDKGTPLEAVQQVLASSSKQISRECWNRCVITPILTVNESN